MGGSLRDAGRQVKQINTKLCQKKELAKGRRHPKVAASR
jgi:hypothetical protein